MALRVCPCTMPTLISICLRCPSLVQGTGSDALLRLLGLRVDTAAEAAVLAIGAAAALYAGPLLMALLDRDPAAQQARGTRKATPRLMLPRDAAVSRQCTGRVCNAGMISSMEALRRWELGHIPETVCRYSTCTI